MPAKTKVGNLNLWKVNVKNIYLIVVFSIMLVACGPVTPYSTQTLQGNQISTLTPLPSATPTIAFFNYPWNYYTPSATPTYVPVEKVIPSLEVISPENIGRLELINRWGKGNLLSLKVSPNHKLVAVATSTGVYLYHPQSLTQVGYLNVSTNHNGFMQVGFSPDSNLLVVASNYVTLWDVVSQQQVGAIPLSHPLVQPWHVDFTPDGQHVVIEDLSRTCGVTGGDFSLYTIEGYKVFNTNECGGDDAGMGGYFRVVDNRWFYFFTDSWYGSKAFPDEVVKIDLHTNQIVDVIYNDELRRFYDISPDGKLAAYLVGTITEENNIYVTKYKTEVVDIATGQIKDTLKDKVQFVKKDSGEITWKVIDYRNTNQPTTQPCNLDANAQLIGIPNSQDKLVMPSQSTTSLQVIDISNCIVKSKLALQSYNHPFSVYYLDTNDDKLVISSGYLNSILDVKTGEFIPASIESLPFLDSGLSTKMPSLTGLNADGTKMILGSQEISNGTFRPIGYTLQVVDIATGKTLWEHNPSGNRLIKIYPGTDPSTEIIVDNWGMHEWNLDTGKEINSLQEVGGVYCYPDGQKCIIARRNGQIHVWDVKSWEDLYTFDSGQYLTYVQGISPISKKGRVAILYTDWENPWKDMHVAVFDIHSGKKVTEVATEEQGGLELIKDQPYFVYNRKDGYIELWSIDQNTPVKTFLGSHTINNQIWGNYPQYYGDTFLSSDARIFITAENGLAFWDVKTGVLLAKINNTPSFRYTNPLFSPDGRILITMGSDGTFWVWGVKRK